MELDGLGFPGRVIPILAARRSDRWQCVRNRRSRHPGGGSKVYASFYRHIAFVGLGDRRSGREARGTPLLRPISSACLNALLLPCGHVGKLLARDPQILTSFQPLARAGERAAGS